MAADLRDAHPDLRPRVQAMIDACPYRLGVLSVWRSSKRQAELYDGWVRRLPGFNPANPPGTSLHETTLRGKPAALAVDLEDYNDPRVFPWCHANARTFGLRFPYAKRTRRPEPWHAETNGQPWKPPVEDDMTDDDRKLLREVHQMLTALGAPRKPDHKDRDTQRVDLGDLLTVLTAEIRAVRDRLDNIGDPK